MNTTGLPVGHTAGAEQARAGGSHPTHPGHFSLRPARPDDATVCGHICYEAFREIAARHGFPFDFPDPATAVTFFDMILADPDIYVVVAEVAGNVVGSNALWQQSTVAGIGPITIDPAIQNGTIGRALMEHVLERGVAQHDSVRLVQAAYHNRSLALYTKLGFEAREPLSVFQGEPLDISDPGHRVRSTRMSDIADCEALHVELHGYSRTGELASAIGRGTALVVESDRGVTGYATEIGFFGHAIGRSNPDLQALIRAADAYAGPGFLVPTRNSQLMRWCLSAGLRIVQPMTLMTHGTYRRPKGAYLPSILF